MANLVYNPQEIDIAIGNTPAAKYMQTLAGQCEGKQPVYGGIVEIETMHTNFRMNAIPEALLSGGLLEYEDFLAARRRLMAERWKTYYWSL
ncbi:hypothetical protein [Thiorhodococcus minor]|uniref:Uncharacterized protein n=1 Tax=Thiorhodococcus minor TaxID=57489 RepID=A0A6M0JW15_9GAMM|nr:hypothetical protein [Thiorhodococcus minor]NEV60375.1 hypothetical protein [Thiorhodococcus minor]